MLNFNTIFGPADEPSRQIAPKMLADEFGEVSIRQVGDRLQVAAAVAMGAFYLGDGESCTAGLALDASQSMKDSYGRGKTLPADICQQYIDQGMYDEVTRDGMVFRVLSGAARKDVERQGLIKATRNTVQEPAAKMIESLIRTFASGGIMKGQCHTIYWACGDEGKDIEPLGSLTFEQLKMTAVSGPKKHRFGPQTHLAPPFRFFADRWKTSNGVYVFVTDGRIDDEEAVVAETHRVAEEMAAGARPSVKCVLLGVGKQIDVEQFDRIDDMEMPEHLVNYDIWNSKVLTEMRDMNDAWSEIFDPETEIGTSLTVSNDRGDVVFKATDRVNALITFEMPAGSRYFEMVLDGETTIRQALPTA